MQRYRIREIANVFVRSVSLFAFWMYFWKKTFLQLMSHYQSRLHHINAKSLQMCVCWCLYKDRILPAFTLFTCSIYISPYVHSICWTRGPDATSVSSALETDTDWEQFRRLHVLSCCADYIHAHCTEIEGSIQDVHNVVRLDPEWTSVLSALCTWTRTSRMLSSLNSVNKSTGY